MALSAEQIMAAEDRPLLAVHVPEWATAGDDTVYLRPMDGGTLYAFQRSLADAPDNQLPDDFMTRFVIACLVSEKGERLFRDKDIAKLNAKSGAVIKRLFDEAQKLNLLNSEAAADFPNASEPTSDNGSGSA